MDNMDEFHAAMCKLFNVKVRGHITVTNNVLPDGRHFAGRAGTEVIYTVYGTPKGGPSYCHWMVPGTEDKR